jgi:hypothetical protein
VLCWQQVLLLASKPCRLSSCDTAAECTVCQVRVLLCRPPFTCVLVFIHQDLVNLVSLLQHTLLYAAGGVTMRHSRRLDVQCSSQQGFLVCSVQAVLTLMSDSRG